MGDFYEVRGLWWTANRRKARRRYVCVLCGKLIKVGEEYWSVRKGHHHRPCCLKCAEEIDYNFHKVLEVSPIWKK